MTAGIDDDGTAAAVHPGRRPGHWFWSGVRREWPAFGQIALAAAVINLFALGSRRYRAVMSSSSRSSVLAPAASSSCTHSLLPL